MNEALSITVTPELASTSAQIAIGMEDYDRAYAYFVAGLKTEQDTRVLQYELGRMAAESGRYLDEGAAALEQLIEGPTMIMGNDFAPFAHLRLAQILAKLDRKEEAREIAEQGLSLKPNKDAGKALDALIDSL